MRNARSYIVLMSLLLMTCTLACKSKKTGEQTNQSGNDNANANVQLGGMSGGQVPNGKIFRGSIGDSRLQMTLNRDGDKLSGTYFYQKVGSDISLKGSISAQGDFTLQEFDSGGKQTGEFKGKWTEPAGLPSASLEGTWAKPNSKQTQPFYATQQMIELTSGARVVTKEMKEENKKEKYSVNAEYPELTGTSNSNSGKFNQEVKNLIAKEVKEFKDGVMEASAGGDESSDTGNGSDIQIFYDVMLATDDLISVSFEISAYSQGAAHPSNYSQVLNYDLKAGNTLKLADLFKPNSDFLGAISRFSISDLKSQFGNDADSEWIERGAGPDKDNYLNWNISRKGLVVTFDSYQVASYAEGAKHVIVPFVTLKDVSKPDGPISSVSK